MTAGKPGAVALGDRPAWRIFTVSLAAAVLLEAAFAGVMLSGAGWARGAHAATAVVLVAATLAAGVTALIVLRRIAYGPKLGWSLLSLAAVMFVQGGLGALTAKGANLTWLHVPLGAALVGFAVYVAMVARRLGGNDA
jgi:hypothetical protein